MKLNLDKIWDKVSPYQNLTHLEYVELNKQLGIPHIHNILTKEVIESPSFKFYINNTTQYLPYPEFWFYGYDKIASKLSTIEDKLSKLLIEELKEEDFYPYIDLLFEFFYVESTKLPNVCHYSPWKYKTKKDLEDLNYVVNKINSGLTDENIIQIYRKVLMYGWGCVEIGEYNLAISLLKPFHNLDISSVKLHRPNYQNKLSSGLILAKAYLGNKEIQKTKNIYQKILDKNWDINFPYLDLTRILEVSIELYNIEPTKNNKLQVLNNFLKSTKKNFNYQNHTTETIREKLLIVYFLLSSLYGYKLK